MRSSAAAQRSEGWRSVRHHPLQLTGGMVDDDCEGGGEITRQWSWPRAQEGIDREASSNKYEQDEG